MRNLLFMPKAWQDLGWWVKNDIKSVKKIYTLLENSCKTPFDGIGQPEDQC